MTSARPPGEGPSPGAFAHDGQFFRRLARFGAMHGPKWFVEASPPVIGLCVAAALPRTRRVVRDNLRRIRGPVGPLREAYEVATTFTSYAGCLTEILATGSKNGALADLDVTGREHVDAAIAEGKGVVIVTAHTAGWELVGPAFRAKRGLEVVMVMQAERDAGARDLSDRARRASGVLVAHVGDDPLASLPLLHNLRAGAAVALQIDRVPRGMRSIPVTRFGDAHAFPEGPLRLAQVAGAPILPLFCARQGRHRYSVEAFPPIRLARRAPAEELQATAQALSDGLAAFVRRHPTQWFDFQLHPEG